jgi:hypothetical protein
MIVPTATTTTASHRCGDGSPACSSIGLSCSGFERGHAAFQPIESLVDIVESPQHSVLEAGDVVSKLAKPLIHAFLDAVTAIGEAALHSVEAIGHGLVDGGKAVEDIFVFHRSI